MKEKFENGKRKMRVKRSRQKREKITKTANGNAQRVIEIKHQMSATGDEAMRRCGGGQGTHKSAKVLPHAKEQRKNGCHLPDKLQKSKRNSRGEPWQAGGGVCRSFWQKWSRCKRHATLRRRQLPRQMKSSRIHRQRDETLCAQIQFTCVRVTGLGNQKRVDSRRAGRQARLKAVRQGSVTCP